MGWACSFPVEFWSIRSKNKHPDAVKRRLGRMGFVSHKASIIYWENLPRKSKRNWYHLYIPRSYDFKSVS